LGSNIRTQLNNALNSDAQKEAHLEAAERAAHEAHLEAAAVQEWLLLLRTTGNGLLH
jgi:hypothetical protein